MTIAIIWGFTLTTLIFIASHIQGTNHRMSGNLVYDFFMGASLNPRVGVVDLKMWAEIRVPWPILFYISVSCALKQYETRGYITAPAAFMVLAHFLYVNACQKGEECIPTSWDMFYEKDGKCLFYFPFPNARVSVNRGFFKRTQRSLKKKSCNCQPDAFR